MIGEAVPADSPATGGKSDQSGSPDAPYRNVRRKLEFPDALKKRQRCAESADAKDPVPQLIQKVQEEGLESSSLLADHAFDGLNTPEAVKETTINVLAKIIQEERSYQELADATEFDARKLHPLPWLKAVERVAECNGYHTESLQVLLQANLSFLEHPETVLTHTGTVKSKVSPPQTCICGLPPSLRSHAAIQPWYFFLCFALECGTPRSALPRTCATPEKATQALLCPYCRLTQKPCLCSLLGEHNEKKLKPCQCTDTGALHFSFLLAFFLPLSPSLSFIYVANIFCPCPTTTRPFTRTSFLHRFLHPSPLC